MTLILEKTNSVQLYETLIPYIDIVKSEMTA